MMRRPTWRKQAWMRARAVRLALVVAMTPGMGTPAVFALGHETLRPTATDGVASWRLTKDQLRLALLPHNRQLSDAVFAKAGEMWVDRRAIEQNPGLLLELEEYLKQAAQRQGLDPASVEDLARAAQAVGIKLRWYDSKVSDGREALQSLQQASQELRTFTQREFEQDGERILRLDSAWFGGRVAYGDGVVEELPDEPAVVPVARRERVTETDQALLAPIVEQALQQFPPEQREAKHAEVYELLVLAYLGRMRPLTATGGLAAVGISRDLAEAFVRRATAPTAMADSARGRAPEIPPEWKVLAERWGGTFMRESLSQIQGTRSVFRHVWVLHKNGMASPNQIIALADPNGMFAPEVEASRRDDGSYHGGVVDLRYRFFADSQFQAVTPMSSERARQSASLRIPSDERPAGEVVVNKIVHSSEGTTATTVKVTIFGGRGDRARDWTISRPLAETAEQTAQQAAALIGTHLATTDQRLAAMESPEAFLDREISPLFQAALPPKKSPRTLRGSLQEGLQELLKAPALGVTIREFVERRRVAESTAAHELQGLEAVGVLTSQEVEGAKKVGRRPRRYVMTDRWQEALAADPSLGERLLALGVLNTTRIHNPQEGDAIRAALNALLVERSRRQPAKPPAGKANAASTRDPLDGPWARLLVEPGSTGSTLAMTDSAQAVSHLRRANEARISGLFGVALHEAGRALATAPSSSEAAELFRALLASAMEQAAAAAEQDAKTATAHILLGAATKLRSGQVSLPANAKELETLLEGNRLAVDFLVLIRGMSSSFPGLGTGQPTPRKSPGQSLTRSNYPGSGDETYPLQTGGAPAPLELAIQWLQRQGRDVRRWPAVLYAMGSSGQWHTQSVQVVSVEPRPQRVVMITETAVVEPALTASLMAESSGDPEIAHYKIEPALAPASSGEAPISFVDTNLAEALTAAASLSGRGSRADWWGVEGETADMGGSQPAQSPGSFSHGQVIAWLEAAAQHAQDAAEEFEPSERLTDEYVEPDGEEAAAAVSLDPYGAAALVLLGKVSALMERPDLLPGTEADLEDFVGNPDKGGHPTAWHFVQMARHAAAQRVGVPEQVPKTEGDVDFRDEDEAGEPEGKGPRDPIAPGGGAAGQEGQLVEGGAVRREVDSIVREVLLDEISSSYAEEPLTDDLVLDKNWFERIFGWSGGPINRVKQRLAKVFDINEEGYDDFVQLLAFEEEPITLGELRTLITENLTRFGGRLPSETAAAKSGLVRAVKMEFASKGEPLIIINPESFVDLDYEGQPPRTVLGTFRHTSARAKRSLFPDEQTAIALSNFYFYSKLVTDFDFFSAKFFQDIFNAFPEHVKQYLSNEPVKEYPHASLAEGLVIAVREALKNAQIWGNRNREGSFVVVRWGLSPGKLVIDVIDESTEPVNFGKTQPLPAGVDHYWARDQMGMDVIKLFLPKDKTKSNEWPQYDLPLLDQSGKRVGQIVRLEVPLPIGSSGTKNPPSAVSRGGAEDSEAERQRRISRIAELTRLSRLPSQQPPQSVALGYVGTREGAERLSGGRSVVAAVGDQPGTDSLFVALEAVAVGVDDWQPPSDVKLERIAGHLVIMPEEPADVTAVEEFLHRYRGAMASG